MLEGRKEVGVDSLSTTDLIANPGIQEWKSLSQNNEAGHGPGSEADFKSGSDGAVASDPEAGAVRGKLGPHLKQLLRMVEDQPRAKIKDFYLILRDLGYHGSYDLVKKKIHSFRRDLGRQAGLVFASPDAPYAQIELGKVALKGPAGVIKAHLFTMVLGHSGRYYAELIENCDMGSFLQCHQNACVFFGGVPAGVFYDTHESPIMRRLVGGYPFHLPIVDCAMHYGYIAQATPAFAPWMKGRLKRPGKILKKLFFPGCSFANVEAANADMQVWISQFEPQAKARDRRDRLHRGKLEALPDQGFNFRGRRQFLKLRT